jgi:hypothetical protein
MADDAEDVEVDEGDEAREFFSASMRGDCKNPWV